MSHADLTLRRAAPADAALIADLGARTFTDAFGADNDPAAMERYVAEAFSVDRIAAELEAPQSTFFLCRDPAFDEARPVGYARVLGGSTTECVESAKPIELVRLYIEGTARGRGYGSALMRACLAAAAEDGFETMWLGVWDQNDGARRFYRRWGFRDVGTQDFMLGGERQTDIVMARAVTPART